MSENNEEENIDIIELIEKRKYKLHDKLGEGSYGEVFLAEELKTREPYAIKVMQLATNQQLRNFIKERYFSTYFQASKNILQAVEVYVINDEIKKETEKEYHISQDYEVDDEDENSDVEMLDDEDRYGVLVLEPMDFDLMDYIISKGRLAEEESRLIFREICKGMKHCHEKKVAHLDLKPDNILLKLTNPDTQQIRSLKICDFGFAVEWEKIEVHNLPPNFRILFGTKEYQSPETFKCKFTDYHLLDKVDIWSLGVTLFVMITGLFPFVEKNGVLYTVGLDEVAKYCNVNNGGFNNCKYEDTAVHLIEIMLHQDPTLRPSVSEILNHPWLIDKSLPIHRLMDSSSSKKKKKRKSSFLRSSATDKCFEVENASSSAFDTYSDFSDDSSFDDSNPIIPNNNNNNNNNNNHHHHHQQQQQNTTPKKKNKIKEKIFTMYNKLLHSENNNNNNNHNNNNDQNTKKKK